ncbi:hypothetical protein CB0940_01120 [Cercospora beticola]|uniref:Uncharacterized protein n=1 Tax=Cercospora beticola TaxID=122368 RepID=A0A2G5I6K4_CERBT|nr:hypothetical protein CB0940_01120 [Cercospora beticola]PIB00456.1 hypothetical protein CB0940_01120 [Cercospora beticola]WPA96547.1 hypothetical protein RHO25_001154 [Cercospora beticola]
MALKRKRSSPAFSSPGSDGSDVTMQSSPLSSFYHQSKPVDAILTKPTWSWPTYEDSPSHLNSRTRKRHRARPDEEQLCAKTINRLFEAQRQFPHAAPMASAPATSTMTSETPTQRTTLHSFWNLGQRSNDTPMTVRTSRVEIPSDVITCEDCDQNVRPDDAMDLDNGIVENETRCEGCSRQVCDMCAVLGDHRMCLSCAGRPF